MPCPRLFYVLDSLEEDEVGEQVVILLSRLPRSRFDARVVSLGAHGLLGARLREMKITVHRLDLMGAAGALLAVPRLHRLLSGLNVELLQTFQPWSGTVAQLAAPRGTEVFRWVHGFPPTPTTMEERVQGWLERRASPRRARRFVASDAGAVERIRRRYRVDQVDVVPPCLDLHPLREGMNAVSVHDARLRMGLDDGQQGLLAVSDFRDRARLSQLLDGFATARREEPGLRLFLLGQGPEEGSVRGYAGDLQLEDSVVFIGAGGDRSTVLRSVEAVVDAGSWPGWSRSAVEAMAAELPVLRWVADEDEPDVQRYPARTSGPPDRFARDVLGLLSDASLRRRLAQQSAQQSRAYDVATVSPLWEALYAPVHAREA